MNSARMTVAAPAKVNLFLHVTSRRDDGYHTLESLFVLIDFADTLHLERTTDGAISRTLDLPGIPEANDLTLRAARALRAASGTRHGVRIALDKRIPQGAGLGGGSSDAASVLLALNRLWDLDLSRSALAGVAATLGADVPFFVGGGPAVVRGIGERLTPVSLPATWLVLAFPDAHVATPVVFAAPELTRDTALAKIDVFSDGYGHNDLAPVAAARFPEVAAALEAMAAVSPGARMTGSGACVFAAFPTEHEARAARSVLPKDLRCGLVRTLARHPLARLAV